VRCVEPTEPINPRQKIIGHAMHDPPDVAMNVREQPAEIGDTCRRPCPAEKPVPLDQDGLAIRAAAEAAAAMPAGPPPRTTTSYSPWTGMLRAGSLMN